MTTAPSVIVSSTCYDLRQIRADLADFLQEEMGYIPLLSGLPSFPVDPDQTAVENCRKRVENNVDLMVLVIGGRYGSIDPRSDKSITNLEFLVARSKGIPVYAFVDKQVLTILPLWGKNPKADFFNVVDSPRLFEFVQLVRDQEKVWTQPFETALDIVKALRCQFAFLFHDSLALRRCLLRTEMPNYLKSLGSKSIRLALEKPPYWEYKLFLQSWQDEIDRRSDLLFEYQQNLRLQSAESVSINDAIGWFQTRLHELQGWVASGTLLVNEALQNALGPPGVPGDAEKIVQISIKLGDTVENFLMWARRLRCVHIDEPFVEVTKEAAHFVDNAITELVTFPTEKLRCIEEALAGAHDGEHRVLTMTLVLDLANVEAFNAAIAKAERQLQNR